MNDNELFDKLKATPPDLLREIKPDLVNELTGHTGDGFVSNASGGVEHGQHVLGTNQGPQNSFQEQPFQQQQSQMLNAGSLIDDQTAVNLFDTVLPTIVSAVLKKVKGRNIPVSRFQLKAGERETLKPVLKGYLNSINFNVDNPFNALLLVCAVLYGPKVIDVLNEPVPIPPVVTPAPKQTPLKPMAASTFQQPGQAAKAPRKGTFSSTNQPARPGRKPGKKQ
jgi:hypothetical protein